MAKKQPDAAAAAVQTETAEVNHKEVAAIRQRGQDFDLNTVQAGGALVGPDADLLKAKLLADPGVPAAQRDGWRGHVVCYAVYKTLMAAPESGEFEEVPCLALMTELGEVCRLSGWPVISCWAQILRVLGHDRIALGVPIVVKRRPSSTVGRSYWYVSIDAQILPRSEEG